MRNILATYAIFSILTFGCSDSESMNLQDASQNDSPSDVDAGEMEPVFTHKMMKPSGENPFSHYAYDCNQCSFEQWLAIETPEGWTKGPSQVLLPTGDLRSTPSFDGVPDSMDFVPEMPGNEYQLIAKALDGKLHQGEGGGLIAEVQVMRDTILIFAAGRRVHELTDPEGRVFVLFAYHVDPMNVEIPDFQDADLLADFTGPVGWTYSTRILNEELALDTPEVATVLAMRGELVTTWEER